MKKIITTIAIIATLSACAGRVANPVSAVQLGDENKSCKAISYEISSNQDEINRLLPKTNKTGKNVVLGITGWFVLVPWFFMDFSDAEQQEINALRTRNTNLTSISISKKCGI